MRKVIQGTGAALCALALSAAAAAAAERIDREFHESYEVAPGVRLELEHGDGDVSLSTWERDVIQVDVVYHADITGFRLGSRRDFEVRAEQQGSTVRIQGFEPEFTGLSIIGRMSVEYRYTIQAPAYVELDLSGDDGDVEVEGWRAPVSVRLEDGDLSLRDVRAEWIRVELEDGDLRGFGLAGDLEITSEDGTVDLVDCAGPATRIDVQDGDVTIRRCRTDLEITSEDGDVRIDQLQARACDIRTEDGDLDLDLEALARPDIQLRSSDGDLTVTFAPGLDADLEITHGDGRVRLELPAAELERGEHRTSGRIGDGSGRLRVATQDGNVTLREQS